MVSFFGRHAAPKLGFYGRGSSGFSQCPSVATLYYTIATIVGSSLG